MKRISILILLHWIAFQHLHAQQEEEVKFSNGDILLSGTLSFPSAQSPPYKAIILLSGSGPQNRDSELFGFRPFKILADFLNQEGYAVLRFDDRGVGKSTGKSVSESTSVELAEDAQQAFRYLMSRKDIRPDHIGLLGHSEGGIVAPIVATREPVAFLILMAGYGVPGVELSIEQQKALLKASGMSDTFIEASVNMNRALLTMISKDSVSEAEVRTYVYEETLKLLPLLPEAVQAQIPDKQAYANLATEQVIGQIRSRWIRYYVTYDPQPVLKKVKCPVLMLFGELDLQVTPAQNLEIMRQALVGSGNNAVSVATIPKANHLFQEATTGSPMEYSSLKKEFAPGFLSTIKSWLAER